MGGDDERREGSSVGRSVCEGGGWEMLQMATKPFAQPTARSLLESQVRHVHRVFGGRASNAAESNLTVCGCEHLSS